MNVYDDAKLRHFPDRVQAFREGRLPAPVQVLVSLSDTCNHRCRWCTYRDADSPVSELFLRANGSPPVRQLPVGLALCLVRDLADLGVRAVQFTGGGEPMLHPNFGDVLHAALYWKLACAVVTNGTRCRDDWLPHLARCAWVRVSINAGTEATYRRVHRCGRGEWDRAWAFVRDLACAGPDVGVSMVCTPDTAAEAPALVGRAREAGAAYARVTADYRHPGGPPEPWGDLARFERPGFRVLTPPPPAMQPPTRPECWYQYIAPFVGGDGVLYRCCNTSYTARGRVGSLHESPFPVLWRTLAGETFDARGCPECAFTAKNEAIGRLVRPPRGHDLFP